MTAYEHSLLEARRNLLQAPWPDRTAVMFAYREWYYLSNNPPKKRAQTERHYDRAGSANHPTMEHYNNRNGLEPGWLKRLESYYG